MYVYGFRSLSGAELRVYTLGLVCEEKYHADMDITTRTPTMMEFAVVRSMRERRGFDTRRAQLVYFVESDHRLLSHWNLGALQEDEVEEVARFVKSRGSELLKWMKRCPVGLLRGRSVSVPEEADTAERR